MRFTRDDPPDLMRRSRTRRRMWLGAFVVFISVALFLVLLVGLQFTRVTPPPDWSELEADLSPAGTWLVRFDPIPAGLAPEGSPLREPAERERLSGIAQSLHSPLRVYQLEPGDGRTDRWLAAIAVRRPNRMYQKAIQRELEGLAGQWGLKDWSWSIDGRAALLAPDEDLRTLAARVLQQAGVSDGAAEASTAGASPLKYTGRLGALQSPLGNDVADLLRAAGMGENMESRLVEVTWQDDALNEATIVIELEDHEPEESRGAFEPDATGHRLVARGVELPFVQVKP